MHGGAACLARGAPCACVGGSPAGSMGHAIDSIGSVARSFTTTRERDSTSADVVWLWLPREKKKLLHLGFWVVLAQINSVLPARVCLASQID